MVVMLGGRYQLKLKMENWKLKLVNDGRMETDVMDCGTDGGCRSHYTITGTIFVVVPLLRVKIEIYSYFV